MVQPADDNSPESDPAITIRAANSNDLHAILALEQAAPLAAHWSSDHYRSRIESQPQAARFLVAERRDNKSEAEICGFLCARVVADEWEIENVVVKREFRRQGIGSRLMQSAIEMWKEAAAAAFFLEVRESNTAARALYERYGFREAGRRPAYYHDPMEDAVVYTLRCGAA